MTPPDHVGDDPVPHAGGGAQGLSTARLTGLLNGTYVRQSGQTGAVDLAGATVTVAAPTAANQPATQGSAAGFALAMSIALGGA